jgi:serine/threonine protein kinase
MGGAADLGIEDIEDARIIGSGGFSTVYGARHRLIGRPVAVKILNRSATGADRQRFERECEVMGRMSDHPNVVSVHHAGHTADKRPYLVMELVEGGTLAELLSWHGPLRWDLAVACIVPICDVVGKAHALKILHRDIKPENVLLAGDTPKLTDFGIARLRDETATAHPVTASWLHTAPETFYNQRDERSDLYSLASTLYCLIVGHPPFWRPGDDSLNPAMIRLVKAPPPPLEPGAGPFELGALLAAALAKDPADRPQSAAELADRLAAILRSAPPAADGPRTLGELMAAAPPHPSATRQQLWRQMGHGLDRSAAELPPALSGGPPSITDWGPPRLQPAPWMTRTMDRDVRRRAPTSRLVWAMSVVALVCIGILAGTRLERGSTDGPAAFAAATGSTAGVAPTTTTTLQPTTTQPPTTTQTSETEPVESAADLASEAPEPPPGGESIDPFTVELGHCVGDQIPTEVESLWVVPCDEPHLYEVYHVFDVEPEVPDYPGDIIVSTKAYDGCLDTFDEFVGLAFARSVYDVLTKWPSAINWQLHGDRKVVCMLYNLDGSPKTGTARDTEI